MIVRAVKVSESSQVGEARRVCVDAARRAGLDETGAGQVAIVATELATNLVKHAGGGEILVGTWNDPAGSGIDVLALDRGPGMADAAACLRDGFSTAGSTGTGLGAVRRQARSFAIHAPPGGGTAVLARFGRGPADPPSMAKASVPWGAVRVPYRGETTCGDAWAAAADPAAPRDGLRVLMLADGLGHGTEAAHAAEEAVRRFLQAPLRPPADILQAIHLALRPTRGAAIAIARLEPENRRVLYAGIGNISGALVNGQEVRRMVSA